MSPDNSRPEHNHGEAFHLMHYQCNKGHLTMIWNSRDGVTPFMLACPVKDCGEDAQHVHWKLDRYNPAHVLKHGDFFFRDGRPEEARAILRARLKSLRRHGDKYDYCFRSPDGQPLTDEQIIERDLGESHEFKAGWPWLATWPDVAP